jgi:hypothetical protein
MKSFDLQKLGNQKPVKKMPLFGPQGFFNRDDLQGTPIYFGGRIRPFSRENISEILTKHQDDPQHFCKDMDRYPDPNCIMCGKPKSQIWVTPIMCIDCYTYWIEIMHNTGDNLNVPTYFQDAYHSYEHIRGMHIYIHFKPPQHTKPKRTALGFNQKILIGMQNNTPILLIGNDIVQIPSEDNYIDIYKVRAKQGYVPKCHIYIHDIVENHGHVLEGCFDDSAFIGKVICERAYIGNCLSLNNKAVEWPAPDTDLTNYHIKIVDRPYPEGRLNEMIVPAGVTGITQSNNSNVSNHINPGSYCPRCSDELSLIRKINYGTSKKSHTVGKTTHITILPKPVSDELIEVTEKPDYKKNTSVRPASNRETPNEITVPKRYYTELLTRNEKLENKCRDKAQKIKVLTSDLNRLNKERRQKGFYSEYQDTDNSEHLALIEKLRNENQTLASKLALALEQLREYQANEIGM